MSARLAGKCALVTGASRGIGRGIALRLAADGAVVAVHYGRDKSAAETTVAQIEAAGGKAFALACDLRNVALLDGFFAELNRGFIGHGCATGLDILVNNAAYRVSGPVEKLSEAEFDQIFDVNVKALFFVTQRAIGELRDGGRIVNISSTAARHARRRLIAYGASKSAVESLTLGFAAELGARGITVNAIAPGTTETDKILAEIAGNDERKKAWVSVIALQRLGKPSDVAAVVAFLASDDGGWITGHVIPATGGTNL